MDNKVDYSAFCCQYETKIISFAVMKFAYLILAHNNFKLLARLVGMLDHAGNDIFIHIDRKVTTLPQLCTQHSNLHFVSDRADVRWGTVSQIRAIMSTLREASAYGPYDFYHIISGTHLPLKSQDLIQDHFKQFQGSSVLRLWKPDEGDADFKLRRLHFWIANFQSRNRTVRYLVQHVWTLNMALQRLFGVRINKNCRFVKSDSWASLSNEAVHYLISNEKSVMKRYRFSFCGDEYFMATELTAGGLPVADDPNLLYVDFVVDHPRLLDRTDYARLMKEPYIFARKFDDGAVW